MPNKSLETKSAELSESIVSHFNIGQNELCFWSFCTERDLTDIPIINVESFMTFSRCVSKCLVRWLKNNRHSFLKF